jgi:magnesium-transporting ATPase (P-type)
VLCTGNDTLLTPTLWKSIIGQSLFQLVAMYLLVFHGADIFDVVKHTPSGGPSEHYTIVFNAFVLMQLFNQVCVGWQVCVLICWKAVLLDAGFGC